MVAVEVERSKLIVAEDAAEDVEPAREAVRDTMLALLQHHADLIVEEYG